MSPVVLEVHGLRKRLGGRLVLDDVSFECAGGTITVVTGENGAGKSTLASVIAGVMAPDRGLVVIGGAPLGTRSRAAKTGLGYVPEAANPPGHMTGEELFSLVSRVKRCAPLARSIRDALSLEGIAGARIERLSLGERRRVCLAAAFIGEPALLLLDEPTNGLDVQGIDSLVALLDKARARGVAAVVVTHDRTFADRVADRRLHLDHGRLVERHPRGDESKPLD